MRTHDVDGQTLLIMSMGSIAAGTSTSHSLACVAAGVGVGVAISSFLWRGRLQPTAETPPGTAKNPSMHTAIVAAAGNLKAVGDRDIDANAVTYAAGATQSTNDTTRTCTRDSYV